MFDKKSYQRDYYQRNKTRIKKQQLAWRIQHKDDIRDYSKNYCRTNREKRKKYNEKWVQSRRLKCLIHYSGNPPKCACCGESHIEFLTIDHIHGGGRKDRIHFGVGSNFYKWLIDNNFPSGFQVLCYNCNCSKGHYGYCPHKKENI